MPLTSALMFTRCSVMEIDSNEGGKTKELFGGAFSVFLPKNAQDMR